MELTRRQFMTGLAATTAIVAVPISAPKPDPKDVLDRVFYGMDLGRNDMSAISMVRYEGGAMIVESIDVFDFYKT